jgi:RHS repeat-associated protein
VGDYSFGFNGKDKESEFNSGAYDFGARSYNARLGRMFSVDPCVNLIASLSSYCFAGNSVIIYVDYSGAILDFPLAPDGKDLSDEEALFWEIYNQSSKEKQLELDNLITSDIRYEIRFEAETKLGGGGCTYYDRTKSEEKSEDIVKIEIKASLNSSMKTWALGDELETAIQIESGKTGFVNIDGEILTTYTISNDMQDEWQTQCAGAAAFLGCKAVNADLAFDQLDPNQGNLATLFGSTNGSCVNSEAHALNWFNTEGSPQSLYEFDCNSFSCTSQANGGASDIQIQNLVNSTDKLINPHGVNSVMFKKKPSENLTKISRK